VLLAELGASGPSFVHLRTPGLNRPEDQAELICRMLNAASTDVLVGSIVTLHLDRYRVRRLPVR
jgi:hypothetical protein